MTPEEEAANQIPEGGVQDDAVNQIPEGDAPDAVKDDAQGDAEPKTVSVEAVIAETKKRQEAEAQLAAEQQARQAAEQQVEYARQQQAEYARQQQAQQAPIADDEYLNAGQVRQMAAQTTAQMQYSMFMSQHPDAAEILGQGIGTGVLKPSEHFNKVLQANPSLYGLQQLVANGNSQALSVALAAAKQQKAFGEQEAELATLRAAQTANAEQQAAIAAKTGVTSPLSAGGGGAVTGDLPDPNTPEGEEYFERMKAGDFG